MYECVYVCSYVCTYVFMKVFLHVCVPMHRDTEQRTPHKRDPKKNKTPANNWPIQIHLADESSNGETVFSVSIDVHTQRFDFEL